MDYQDWLAHFNPNHDPRNGRFTSKRGGLGSLVGVRKYQNPDGTLTAKGEARYRSEVMRNNQKKKENRVKDEEDLRDPAKWVRDDIDNAKDVADAGGRLVDEFRKLKSSSRQNKTFDLSKMSDSELREHINRMQMEEQYSRLMNSREAAVGRTKVDDVLDRVGSAVTITSSALGIALAIRKLMGP